jgi:hypothetical protein
VRRGGDPDHSVQRNVLVVDDGEDGHVRFEFDVVDGRACRPKSRLELRQHAEAQYPTVSSIIPCLAASKFGRSVRCGLDGRDQSGP